MTDSKCVSNHIPTRETKQWLYFPAITTVCWSPWWVAWQRLGGHGVFCLNSSPLCCRLRGDGALWCGGALFCGASTRGNGFHVPGRVAVCRPCFMPTDACSSWRGLLMTCTSLEQHWGCCERVWGKGRTTPRNLTEPLWRKEDVRTAYSWNRMNRHRNTEESLGREEGYKQV